MATEITANQPAAPIPDLLARLSIFEGERAGLLAWLSPRCRVERMAAGTLLLGPTHPKDRIYVIVRGEVEIRLGRRNEQVIAILGPDQCVGEMSVIERVPPSANVVTRTDCTLVAIEGDTLRQLLDTSHVLARNLLRLLARRVRKDNLILRHSLEQQAASAQHARLDPLTGLFNRRWLDETLPQLIERHQLHSQPLSLLMLDIDHFKNFNDTHGHLAGDQALIGVARALQAHIRNRDQAVRFGGEEFLIILPDTATAEACRIATRLRNAIRRTAINSHEGLPLPCVTVSIGLAEGAPDESAEALQARADAALYQAKQEGRDRLVISTRDGRLAHSARIPRLRRDTPHA
jgi:diguanylate cyclase (GGDEF)-like protein